jgi:hypothetical protein
VSEQMHIVRYGDVHRKPQRTGAAAVLHNHTAARADRTENTTSDSSPVVM